MLFGSSCPPASLLPAAPLRCFLRVALALCWHYRPADIMAATGKQRQVNSDRCLRPPAAARNVSRKTVFNHSKKFGSDSESFVSEPGGRVQTGADTRRFRFGGERETNTWRQKGGNWLHTHQSDRTSFPMIHCATETPQLPAGCCVSLWEETSWISCVLE